MELVPAVLGGELQFQIGVNAANLSVIHSRPPHFPPQNPNLLKNNIFYKSLIRWHFVTLPTKRSHYFPLT